MNFVARDRVVNLDKPILMGVLDVSPATFLGKGSVDVEAAVAHGLRVVAEGATIIDVGGTSSRPGGWQMTRDEELAQVLPVLQRLMRETKAIISIDTRNPEVAEVALAMGAQVVNDISGLSDARMAGVVARYGAGVVIMHMHGTPDTMDKDGGYDDVVGEVGDFFRDRIEVARAAGIRDDQMILDLGLGFGKNLEHSLALLRAVPEFRRRFAEQALLVGASRKPFIGKLTDREKAPEGRIFGTVAVTALAVRDGANILRVHDVRANHDAVMMAQAIDGNLRQFSL